MSVIERREGLSPAAAIAATGVAILRNVIGLARLRQR